MRADLFASDDTIVALATPPGRSALALLRLTGRASRAILARLVPDLPAPLPQRRPILAAIRGRDGETIDRGLVTFFPAPHSATGEDVAEISLHGSPVVVGCVLEAASAAGARPAAPGEFSRRAFLLGKIDLLEAEAVRELIEARTPAAARASARRLHGELSETLARVRESLVRAAAEIAAALDFSEDVGEVLPPGTAPRIAEAAEELARLCASAGRGALLAEGARVVILGRPNAGKSTLFNALVGTDRAIVTGVPGTTRDTLHATLDVGGIPIELVDTAGLRATEDPVERIGVGRARAAGAAADAVLYVYDAGLGWTEEDDAALSELDGIPAAVLANKIDTAAASPPGPAGRRTTALCGLDAAAGETLRGEVARLLDGGGGPPAEALSAVVGSARQRDALRRAGGAAAAARESLERGDSPEYAAAHVGEALDALADLFGETTPEEILERLFAEFCVGK
ncbi:MAG TPA: tRNA uridine-5-carboxymethylaminomethyl(34) synthesis GTPase MnmE [Anaeromyxobacter sp.]